MESLTQTLSGLCVNDQQEIGTAMGIGGSIRSTISSIASTIYTVILSNRLAQTVPSAVGLAATGAGLPSSSIPSLLQALSLGTTAAFQTVEGLTPQIQEAATASYREGSLQAYKTVFLSSIAFSGLAVLLCIFAPNVENLMTGQVAALLHHSHDKKANELAVEEKRV